MAVHSWWLKSDSSVSIRADSSHDWQVAMTAG